MTRVDSGAVFGDVRDLLGMRRPAALVMTILYAAAFAILAWYSRPYVSPWWPEILAVVGIAVAAVALVRSPGDPVPPRWTALIALCTLIAPGAVFSVLPSHPPLPLLTWPIGAVVGIASYLAVRGRTLVGWAAMAVTTAIVATWSSSNGAGWLPGVMRCLPSVTVLLTATFFAATLRPAARQTVLLRERVTERHAAEAAAIAARQERERQLEHLNAVARPMLERLARGTELDDAARLECVLVEARLRDTLRAPGLLSDDVSAAAERARRHGVTVVLLDDGGLDGLAPQAVDRIRLRLARALEAVEGDGTLTARAVPPGRDTALTVLTRDAHGIARVELDSDGYDVG